MRSWRVLLSEVSVDGVFVVVDYADIFVVVREGDAGPGSTDWEVTIRSSERMHLEPGRHDLHLQSVDGHVLEGAAVLRFSDWSQHHFRGDADLAGVTALIA